MKTTLLDDIQVETWTNEKGEKHRIDGPAVIHSNGNEFWYKDGLRHRIDGPAITTMDGDSMWFRDGDLHRENGPAMVRGHSDEINWFLNGKEYSKEDYKKIMRIKKLDSLYNG